VLEIIRSKATGLTVVVTESKTNEVNLNNRGQTKIFRNKKHSKNKDYSCKESVISGMRFEVFTAVMIEVAIFCFLKMEAAQSQTLVSIHHTTWCNNQKTTNSVFCICSNY
jgi:hypothetical protein